MTILPKRSHTGLASAAALALLVSSGLSSCSKPAEQNATGENQPESKQRLRKMRLHQLPPRPLRPTRARARKMRKPCSSPCPTISRRKRPSR